MSLKHLLFSLSLLTLAALAGDTSLPSSIPPQPQGTTPGRFQLLNATYTVHGSRERQESVIMRVDTATGKVWKLLAVEYTYKVPGKPDPQNLLNEGWTPLCEDFNAGAETASRVIEYNQTGRWPTNSSTLTSN